MENRECRAGEVPEMTAPDLPYLPQDPRNYTPGIALIGCGGIAPYHLRAYRKAGYRVLALADIDSGRARACADECFPNAAVVTDYRRLLDRHDIEVVDVATHPEQRVALIEDALSAGKHVLSQKPFVVDLEVGERLVNLASSRNLKLAVNQNGRWAPHFSYMRHAVQAGLIGTPTAVQVGLYWDHNWTADTPFNDIHHLILYDFAIHWFDLVNCILGVDDAMSVYATTARSPAQRAKPPLVAHATIRYPQAIASLTFDADTRRGALDHTVITGTEGTLVSEGPDLNTQRITLVRESGRATPQLSGDWFTNGFHGTMAELLCAIEEDREPYNSGSHNLGSLALCFAAIESAESGNPTQGLNARRLPESAH